MNAQQAVRQAIREAAAMESFFDLSDVQRLSWMLEKAFKLGRKVARGCLYPLRHSSDHHAYRLPTRWKGHR